MANVKYITSEELKQIYQNPNTLICDIREPDEYRRENIIGAKNTPLSTFNLDEMNELAEKHLLVFHCQSGNRTKMNESVFKQINCNEVLVLRDGINDWKKLNCAVAKNNKAPLPIMRQVQIVAGSLIVLGVLLSFLVSLKFIFLSGLVGVGLMFAGMSGYCGMANILMLLPYNKQNHCNNGCR